MGKTSKTIRINDTVLSQLEKKATEENRSLSNLIETICEEYFSIITRKEYCVNGEKYMPVHMNEDEIYKVVHWALSISDNGHYSEFKVRKSHGGKGIDFLFNNYSIDDEGKKYSNRRYSFSIDPNWDILDFFDHWTSHGKRQFASEKLKAHKSEKLILEIKENIITRPPELNEIFKQEKWTIIYSNHEKYYLY